ncbi:hypothetical protein [Limosilactobacillus mucosae]|uniref:Uncharacterized protein n=1 Tax=Limosilactobacillus mucosae LM1 TaxID=1130798 RepID=A0A0D4CJU4_LIMMU|nr:hypothetical protein [Limosilactobacillus mucosae]AJT50136.1 hypothetical protein LBLM1_02985 [Limosilactobacillus mucosae LM1]SDN54199.1 hypothetical protein SAMN05216430_10849 [Limosilactobacillus mucosae]SEL10897.1 hypothetical protein SAMN05216545_10952 [Limosilactobacillus mucosae]SFK23908.1 hypothetical protein SAMN05216461_10852 [Limosilactobacillus mucosae]
MLKVIGQFKVAGKYAIIVQGASFIKWGSYLVDKDNHKVKILSSNFPSVEADKKKILMLQVDGVVSGDELKIEPEQ